MKAVVATDEVEVFGQNRTNNREFTFKSSQKAVDILVSRIYKHKVRAVVRELCCNAIDAHVAAGTPERPFAVTLPSSIDPRFVVRDFGPGLTPEQVDTVYTRFFESTKDESNDYIGALGLGCKVPFCLVDVYTVTSYQNGLMTSYTMFRKDGMLQFRAETVGVPTDQPDGLEVAVPVAPEQFGEFKQKAAAVLYWFDLRPELPALEEDFTKFDEEIFEKIETDEGLVRILKSKDHYRTKSLEEYGGDYGGGNFIRMGQIIYPVNEAVSAGRRGYTIVVDVPIGSVDIQAGREELSYDETTKKYLKERFERVSKQIRDHFCGTLDGAPNIRAAMVAAQKCRGAELQIDLKYKDLPLGSSNYAWPSTKYDVRVEKINTLHGVEVEYLSEDDMADLYDDEDDYDCYRQIPAKMRQMVMSGNLPFAFAGDRIKLEHAMSYYAQDMRNLLDSHVKLDEQMTLIYLLVDDDTNISRKLTELRKKLRKEFANKHDLVALVIMRSGNNYGHVNDHHTLYRMMQHGKAPEPAKPLGAKDIAKIKEVLDPRDRVVLLSELKSSTKDLADMYVLLRGNTERSFNHRANWRATKAPDKPVLYWPLVNGTLEHCANRRNRSEWGPGKLDKTLNAMFGFIDKHYAAQFGKDIILVPESRLADLPEGSVNIPQLFGALLKQKCQDRRWLRLFVGWLTGQSEHLSHYANNVPEKLVKLLHPEHPIHWLVEEAAYEKAAKADMDLMSRLLWLFKHKRYEEENERLSQDERRERQRMEKQQRKEERKRQRLAEAERKKRTKKREPGLTRLEQLVADFPLILNDSYGRGSHYIDDIAIYANAKFELLKAEQGVKA